MSEQNSQEGKVFGEIAETNVPITKENLEDRLSQHNSLFQNLDKNQFHVKQKQRKKTGA